MNSLEVQRSPSGKNAVLDRVHIFFWWESGLGLVTCRLGGILSMLVIFAKINGQTCRYMYIYMQTKKWRR